MVGKPREKIYKTEEGKSGHGYKRSTYGNIQKNVEGLSQDDASLTVMSINDDDDDTSGTCQ